GATVELRDPANNLVSSSISYNSSTRTVTLTPVSPLSTLTTYTARVIGNASGVKDIAGNALAGNYSWTFTTTPGDTTKPLITSITPANGGTDVSTGASITATFNEKMDATSINTNSFELRNTLNQKLQATVVYNQTTRTATLTPSAAMTDGAAYTASIKGSPNGVKDSAGNYLARDTSWSFTTASAKASAISIFPPSSTPANNENDGSPLEVGMKFRSSQPGQIVGMRYYKGATFTTGTRTGHLWSANGTLLATATFTNETASGWQQVMFSSPVSIAANTTYVISYFSSGGHYVVTSPYFGSQAPTNGPLTGLSYGMDGANGVYSYSATSVFPTSSYNSSNYWVDVLFVPDQLIARTVQQPASQTKETPNKPVVEIEQLNAEFDVTVHPNPAGEYFNVKVESADNAPVNIRIIDAYGQVVERKEKVTVNRTNIMGQTLKAGTYLIEVIQNDKRQVIKVIKVN